MRQRTGALEIALKNEMSEHEFYMTHARRTQDPVGKAMFEQIAGEEMEHHERLQQLHDTWARDGKWPETVPLQVKGTPVKDVLKKAIAAAGKAAGNADDLEAIRTAIDFEANGALYYARLRDQVVDPKEKAFFNLLADIEHEHYASLKDAEEYLTDPAAWYQKMERGGLDGA